MADVEERLAAKAAADDDEHAILGLLVARLRSGKLCRSRIAAAAGIGYRPALLVSEGDEPLSSDWADALRYLHRHQSVAWAMACAERVQGFYSDSVSGTDLRLLSRKLLRAIRIAQAEESVGLELDRIAVNLREHVRDYQPSTDCLPASAAMHAGRAARIAFGAGSRTNRELTNLAASAAWCAALEARGCFRVALGDEAAQVEADIQRDGLARLVLDP